ncbi:EF-Tu/IF-2/RF-3 family GTPase [Candidatus Nitrosocosmicus hydrocola]|uniref:EF-Tu/IF-2/RF-3 family GTPase n=1 Tax=Candidatus Nitrosocosmicus hydrocola TaxID=1826872 RepID=UPI0011E5BC10|nr:EF-Tu/IF-2/RF-3 family GTPase [Candidatus Nitrosocosmicus hydrocola]
MNSYNFVLLGDTSIAGELGKKGTSSDITIYDRKTDDKIISYCFPNTYPEKLQPLLQSVAMSDYAIINISKLDTFLGEQLVAVDIFGIKNGFILYSYEIDAEKVRNIIKNTGLSSFVILDSLDQLKNGITKLGQDFNNRVETKIEIDDDDDNKGVCVSIDHAFDVKGVGTVVLGSVRQGEIKPYDELILSPANKPIMIKSIQMHDDPVNISKKPSRVGLAVKGVSAKDISRGDIITSSGLAKIANNEFQIKFIKNQFFKGDLSETQNYMICVGLQIRTVKIKQIADTNLNITFEKPLAYIKNEKCVLFRPDSKGMRIMGYGIME